MTITHENLIATVAIDIRAPRAVVWDALVTPASIKQYMFGAAVTSDWLEGDPITWHGAYQGKPYENKGTILRIIPQQILQYSHYSSLSGKPDLAENYHVITIVLVDEGISTHVGLTEDHNGTDEEQMESQRHWAIMLSGLKRFVERYRSA